MSKYINAEKLIAEIERQRNAVLERQKNLEKIGQETVLNEIIAFNLNKILSFIDSLQQEKPKIPSNLIDVDAVRDDFVSEIYRVLDADPTNDRANEIIDAFDSLPTVSQEQPEVDLKKEIDRELDIRWRG